MNQLTQHEIAALAESMSPPPDTNESKYNDPNEEIFI